MSSTKNEYRNIAIYQYRSQHRPISVLKWYYWVQVIHVDYSVDFVPKKVKIITTVQNSPKQVYQKHRFQIRTIVSVSRNQYRPALILAEGIKAIQVRAGPTRKFRVKNQVYRVIQIKRTNFSNIAISMIFQLFLKFVKCNNSQICLQSLVKKNQKY